MTITIPPAKLLKIGTLALLLLGSSAVRADQFLVFSTAALHFKNADERRAFTPGIGWEYSPSRKFGFHLGTLSDSFGFQAVYGGVNWATSRLQAGPVSFRFLAGATVVRKQFHKNTGPETKVLPFPVLEIGLSPKAVLNVSGSPQLDQAGLRNNAVLFLQYKMRFL